MRRILIALCCVALSACGGKDASPTAPSTPTPAPVAPAPVRYMISGQVTLGSTGQAVSGATVTVVDGPNSGLSSTTDGNGRYSLPGLTFAGFSMQVTAPGYTTVTRGGTLTAGVLSTTINLSILPSAIWSQGGTGNTVFDMPRYVTRVRVIADYGDFSSNFIVKVDGRLVVNELIGRGWNTTHYDGISLTTGGVTEITNSTGVAWLFTEQR